jgi:hypothetical protein
MRLDQMTGERAEIAPPEHGVDVDGRSVIGTERNIADQVAT